MGGALLGFLAGMIVVACWVGAAIGWQQSHLWPAWLSVPLGAAMGPTYLVVDLESIADGSVQDLIALPQSLFGGAVGALLGWLLIRRKQP